MTSSIWDFAHAVRMSTHLHLYSDSDAKFVIIDASTANTYDRYLRKTILLANVVLLWTGTKFVVTKCRYISDSLPSLVNRLLGINVLVKLNGTSTVCLEFECSQDKLAFMLKVVR